MPKFRLSSFDNRPSASPNDIIVEVYKVTTDATGAFTINTDKKDIIGYAVLKQENVSDGVINGSTALPANGSEVVVLVFSYANREAV